MLLWDSQAQRRFAVDASVGTVKGQAFFGLERTLSSYCIDSPREYEYLYYVVWLFGCLYTNQLGPFRGDPHTSLYSGNAEKIASSHATICQVHGNFPKGQRLV